MADSEAMASGLPVIISRNVGAKGMVQNGVNGFVVKKETFLVLITQSISLLVQKRLTAFLTNRMMVMFHRIIVPYINNV